jgi:tripartite-type tricarboxylate transporter receptor subunit TctC
MMKRAVLAAAVSLGLVCATPSQAASADQFYAGRNLTMYLSAGAGGIYTAYANAFAPHFSAHIPGKPRVLIDYMNGAGGLRAMNFLNTTAPRDGSVIGLVHASLPFAPLYGIQGARFDSMKMNWIGAMDSSPGICVAWHQSPIKVWEDLFKREFIVGGSGAGSQMEILPQVINKLFGTKIKVISGYPGGNDVFLAMERGEVQGRCGSIISGINATRPDWFSQKKVSVPIQIGMTRNRLFPDVPALGELAKDEHTRQVLQLVLSPMDMFGPIVAPPGVPAERVAVLRAAYQAAMNDPKFRADAARLKLDVAEVSHDRIAGLLKTAYAMPPTAITAAREAMNLTGSQ